MEVEERIGGKVEVEKVVHQLLFGDWKEVIKARRKDLPELLHRFLLLDQNFKDDLMEAIRIILYSSNLIFHKYHSLFYRISSFQS